MTFLLDAQLDLTPDEHELFLRYALYGIAVYDSDAYVQHVHAAIERYDAAGKPMSPVPWGPSPADLARAFGEITSSVWNIAVGATHELVALTALRITLGSLASGQHIESADLEEILAVETTIRQAAEYLADYLELALTFDGREDLSEH